MATKQITGTLDYKRVAAYIKKSGIGVSVARFDESFLFANGFHMIKAPACPELAHYQSFSQEWERATYQYGKIEQGGRDAGIDRGLGWSPLGFLCARVDVH